MKTINKELKIINTKIKKAINGGLKFIADKVLVEEDLKNPFIVNARWQTCQRCPKFNAKNETCMVCGCFMKIKCKAYANKNKKGKIEITHCPLGNWGDAHLVELYKS